MIHSARLAVMTVALFLSFLTHFNSQALENPFLNVLKERLNLFLKQQGSPSFTKMINEQVMSKHTLSRHQKGLPYFNTDDREIISEILIMVVEKPDGIQMGKEKGTIQLYKDFDFKRDLQIFFLKEHIKKGGYDGHYLGHCVHGPTNRVIVVLNIDSLEPTHASFKCAYPQEKF